MTNLSAREMNSINGGLAPLASDPDLPIGSRTAAHLLQLLFWLSYVQRQVAAAATSALA